MKKLTILLVLVALLLAGCGAAQTPETTTSTEATAEAETVTAPDFTVVDGEGDAVRLHDFFGKPIVLNF